MAMTLRLQLLLLLVLPSGLAGHKAFANDTELRAAVRAWCHPAAAWRQVTQGCCNSQVVNNRLQFTNMRMQVGKVSGGGFERCYEQVEICL